MQHSMHIHNDESRQFNLISIQVRYNVTSWLEKNKDPLNDTVVGVLKSSKNNKLLLRIWDDYKTQEEQAKMGSDGGGKKKGKSSSMMTVSMLYRVSYTLTILFLTF